MIGEKKVLNLKNKINNEKLLQIILLLTVVTLLAACSNTSANTAVQDERIDVVRIYFESWNDKDYVSMYNQISYGFKQIEPTANTLEKFRTYAESQGIESVIIKDLELISTNNDKASVEYNVVFRVNNKDAPFEGIFTLKYKPNDKIPGWKLIHPYGENIDTS